MNRQHDHKCEEVGACVEGDEEEESKQAEEEEEPEVDEYRSFVADLWKEETPLSVMHAACL